MLAKSIGVSLGLSASLVRLVAVWKQSLELERRMNSTLWQLEPLDPTHTHTQDTHTTHTHGEDRQTDTETQIQTDLVPGRPYRFIAI